MLMKEATQAFSAVQIASGRVSGGMLVLGICWWIQGHRWRLRRPDWLPLAFVILFGYAWPYAVQPFLVARHGGALVGMSVSFVPLFTVLLSIPFLRIYPTPRQVLGVFGALLFLIGILLDSHQRAVPTIDLLLAGTVPLGYVLANICIRRRLAHISSLDLSFLSLVGTLICLLPVLTWDFSPPPPQTQEWLWPLCAVLLLGVVGTGLANWMFNRLIQQQGPLFAGMVTNLVPLGAIIWGWADREQVTTLQFASLLGIMLMVAIVQFGAAKPVVVVQPEATT